MVSKQVFNTLDWWMWGRCVRYARWQHPHKSTGWLSARYWGRWHRQRNDRWVFGDPDTRAYLLKFAWTPIRRHVQVLGASSPDDPQLRRYWQARRERAQVFHGLEAWLARRQRHLCPMCGNSLFNGEELHKHHLISRRDGGSDERGNLRLLHLFCHQQAHSGRAPTAALARLHA